MTTTTRMREPIPGMMQTIVLTMDDGTSCKFFGPAVLPWGAPEIRVTKVQFTAPRPLPDGCHFEKLPPIEPRK